MRPRTLTPWHCTVALCPASHRRPSARSVCDAESCHPINGSLMHLLPFQFEKLRRDSSLPASSQAESACSVHRGRPDPTIAMLPTYADGSTANVKGLKKKKKPRKALSAIQWCILLMLLVWVVSASSFFFSRLERENGADAGGLVGLILLGPRSTYGQLWQRKCEAFLRAVEERFTRLASRKAAIDGDGTLSGHDGGPRRRQAGGRGAAAVAAASGEAAAAGLALSELAHEAERRQPQSRFE